MGRLCPKIKIRNPKSEIRNKCEARSTKPETKLCTIRLWDFGMRIGFEFRYFVLRILGGPARTGKQIDGETDGTALPKNQNPKSEANAKHEARKQKQSVHNQALGFRNWDLFRVSLFVLRIGAKP
jgi:hypothetical protein